MEKLNEKLSTYFPLIAVTICAVAIIYPNPFLICKKGIVPALGIIMLTMGLTLTGDDFKSLADKKWAIVTGVLIQFAVMPFAAYWISKFFKASPEELLGMVLVGTSAGGTASNVICYLAGGNVALSVCMTSFSTLCAVFCMPVLTNFYAGAVIEVPVLKMLMSLLQIVLVPVLLGMFFRKFFEKSVLKIKSGIPFVTILLISFIISVIAALNKGNIMNSGYSIYFMVMLHNITGLFLGYYICRLLKYDAVTSRTIAIEVGMQNSGLSVAMAMKHFSYLSALPGAVFSIWHNITGSILAGIWSKDSKKKI